MYDDDENTQNDLGETEHGETEHEQLAEIEKRVREIRREIDGTKDPCVSADENATECNSSPQSDATECHSLQQNATVFENGTRSFLTELPPRQQTAIHHLVHGASVSETARRLEVDRTTVSRWLNHSYPFEMALREKLREVWGETNVGMAAHARKAIGKLAELLDSRSADYRVRAAKSILALTPLARNRAVTGPYMP